MERRSRASPAREHEAVQRGQLALHLVDRALQRLRIVVGHEAAELLPARAGRRRELRADPEQGALHVLDLVALGRPRRQMTVRRSEHRVQLIDVPVRRDARIGLPDPPAREERSLAPVSRSRVDLHRQPPASL